MQPYQVQGVSVNAVRVELVLGVSGAEQGSLVYVTVGQAAFLNQTKCFVSIDYDNSLNE